MSAPTQLLVVIGGLGQTRMRETGLETFALNALSQVDGLMIQRFDWNDRFEEITAWIRRIKNRWNLYVNIGGFSYGGHTVTRVLDQTRDIRYRSCFMVDPVWRRWKYVPSPSSLFGMGELFIPPNVSNLYAWRQRLGIIRGSQVTREDVDKTKWVVNEEVFRKHTNMDSLPAFQDTMLEVLKRAQR